MASDRKHYVNPGGGERRHPLPRPSVRWHIRGVPRMSLSWSARVLFISVGLAAGQAIGSATDALSAVQVLREGGCGGVVPAAKALRHEGGLDAVAQQWAQGTPLAAAAERGGYPARATAGLHVSATDSGVLEVLRRSACRTVTGPEL